SLASPPSNPSSIPSVVSFSPSSRTTTILQLNLVLPDVSPTTVNPTLILSISKILRSSRNSRISKQPCPRPLPVLWLALVCPDVSLRTPLRSMARRRIPPAAARLSVLGSSA
ncbi:hypothetical protein N0V85_009978, partial [Neurospora sp. IMI 360204]